MIHLPKHASFSSLAAYSKCPKSWQLERVIHVPQTQGWARLGGSAVHTATERYDLATGEAPDATALFEQAFTEEIWEAYLLDSNIDTWRASGRATREWPNKEGQDFWWQNGPRFVQHWIDWTKEYGVHWRLAALSGDIPGVELEFKPTIGGHPVRMFLDRLYVLPNGDVVVLDIKTGTWEADALQLGLYAEGVYQATGIRPKYGTFWYSRKGLSGLIDLSKYTPGYLGRLVENFYKAVGAEIFTPAPSALCKSCSVRHACASVGGEQAEKYDPDYILMNPWGKAA